MLLDHRSLFANSWQGSPLYYTSHGIRSLGWASSDLARVQFSFTLGKGSTSRKSESNTSWFPKHSLVGIKQMSVIVSEASLRVLESWIGTTVSFWSRCLFCVHWRVVAAIVCWSASRPRARWPDCTLPWTPVPHGMRFIMHVGRLRAGTADSLQQQVSTAK